jgi:hypothetical protein
MMQRNQFTIKNICTAFGKFPKTKQNQTIFAVPYFNFNFIHFFLTGQIFCTFYFFFLFLPERAREAYTHAHTQTKNQNRCIQQNKRNCENRSCAKEKRQQKNKKETNEVEERKEMNVEVV